MLWAPEMVGHIKEDAWLRCWWIEAPANSARRCPWARRFSPARMQMLRPEVINLEAYRRTARLQ
jgi:hypothetical protein